MMCQKPISETIRLRFLTSAKQACEEGELRRFRLGHRAAELQAQMWDDYERGVREGAWFGSEGGRAASFELFHSRSAVKQFAGRADERLLFSDRCRPCATF